MVGDADTYFHHIMNGGRCESVRDCFQGWSEQDEEAGMIKEQKVEIEKIKEQEASIEAKNSINNMIKII